MGDDARNHFAPGCWGMCGQDRGEWAYMTLLRRTGPPFRATRVGGRDCCCSVERVAARMRKPAA